MDLANEIREYLWTVLPRRQDRRENVLLRRAADEIERLRAYWLTEQKARLDQADLIALWDGAKSKAEIASLRGQLLSAHEECKQLETALDGVREELDGLRLDPTRRLGDG